MRRPAVRKIELDATLSLRDKGSSAYHRRCLEGALDVFVQADREWSGAGRPALIVGGLSRQSRADTCFVAGAATHVDREYRDNAQRGRRQPRGERTQHRSAGVRSVHQASACRRGARRGPVGRFAVRCRAEHEN